MIRIFRVLVSSWLRLLLAGVLLMLLDGYSVYGILTMDWQKAAGTIVDSGVREEADPEEGKKYYWDLTYRFSAEGADHTGTCLSPGETFTLCSRRRLSRKYGSLPALGRAIVATSGDPSRGLIAYAAARYRPGQAVEVFYPRAHPEQAVLSVALTWENLRLSFLGGVLVLLGALAYGWGCLRGPRRQARAGA